MNHILHLAGAGCLAGGANLELHTVAHILPAEQMSHAQRHVAGVRMLALHRSVRMVVGRIDILREAETNGVIRILGKIVQIIEARAVRVVAVIHHGGVILHHPAQVVPGSSRIPGFTRLGKPFHLVDSHRSGTHHHPRNQTHS